MKKKAAKEKQLLLKAKQKNNPCGLSLHSTGLSGVLFLPALFRCGDVTPSVAIF
jgi:predicted esterase